MEERTWFSSHPAMNSTSASSVSSSRAMASSRHRCRPPGSPRTSHRRCRRLASECSQLAYHARFAGARHPGQQNPLHDSEPTIRSWPQRCAERGRISRSPATMLPHPEHPDLDRGDSGRNESRGRADRRLPVRGYHPQVSYSLRSAAASAARARRYRERRDRTPGISHLISAHACRRSPVSTHLIVSGKIGLGDTGGIRRARVGISAGDPGEVLLGGALLVATATGTPS